MTETQRPRARIITPLLSGAGTPLGTLVAFEDVTRFAAVQRELDGNRRDLELAYEELQSTIDELETINEELHERTGELNHVNDFLEAILGSLGLAVAVLDREQRVQVWNERAEDLWGLRQDEAVDHHFLALDIGLPTERLVPALRGTLSGAGGRQDLELRRSIAAGARSRAARR